MPKKSPAPSTALAVIDLEKLTPDQISHSETFDAAKCGQVAQAMLARLEELRIERSSNAVLAGIYFHRIKAQLAHGEFEPWKKKYCAKSRATIARVMSLAMKFAETARIYVPELIASEQLLLSLEAPKGAAATLFAKLKKFVGDCELTELYHKHGVIRIGGYNPPALPASPEERQAAWAERTKSEALGAFNSLHTLGEKWKLCDDDQLALAVANAKKFLKQAEKWLATPAPKRVALALEAGSGGTIAQEDAA